MRRCKIGQTSAPKTFFLKLQIPTSFLRRGAAYTNSRLISRGAAACAAKTNSRLLLLQGNKILYLQGFILLQFLLQPLLVPVLIRAVSLMIRLAVPVTNKMQKTDLWPPHLWPRHLLMKSVSRPHSLKRAYRGEGHNRVIMFIPSSNTAQKNTLIWSA